MRAVSQAIAYLASIAVLSISGYVLISIALQGTGLHSYNPYITSPSVHFFYDYILLQQPIDGYSYMVKILIYNPENAKALIDIVAINQEGRPMASCLSPFTYPDGSIGTVVVSLRQIVMDPKSYKEVACLMSTTYDIRIAGVETYWHAYTK